LSYQAATDTSLPTLFIYQDLPELMKSQVPYRQDTITFDAFEGTLEISGCSSSRKIPFPSVAGMDGVE
jgi:hypothetical protein